MDVERTMEFLLAQQVRFDERQARHEEWQARSEASQARSEAWQARAEAWQLRVQEQFEQTSKEVQAMAGAIHVLIRSVDEDRAAMRELREDVERVTDNVNALVKVVDDLVRRGNGGQLSQ